MAADSSISQHAHAADGKAHWSGKNRTVSFVFLEIRDKRLREMWRFEGGDQRSDIDGDDGDDDAGQEDGGQFVDIFHPHKDQQGHQEETDGTVDPHVVQHGCPFTFRLF